MQPKVCATLIPAQSSDCAMQLLLRSADDRYNNVAVCARMSKR
jgi:hypothetical protein